MWRARVRTPDGFEGFYQEHRDQLLLQCFALTGDLPASLRAVRDAMVVVRHHWRKVSRLERPEDWIRPLAWSRAERRSRSRPWSRQPGVDAADRATLEALGRLSRTQRAVLLLTLLTRSPLDGIAREAGVTRAVAERDLQSATAQFAVHRDVPSTTVRGHVERLARALGDVRWPRASTVDRQGAGRRRQHTLAGVAVVVAGLVAAGTLVTESDGAAPALATQRLTHGASHRTGDPRPSTAAPEPDPLSAQALLTTDQVTSAVAGTWTEAATSSDAASDTSGDGLTFTCQTSRFADPKGLGTLVRKFTGTGPRGRALTAGQASEASADVVSAEQAYSTALGWFAGCASPRVQLVSTAAVTGVGDQAAILVLRDWKDPLSTQVVGVARTGRLVTEVVSTQPDDSHGPVGVDLATRATLLGAAVTGLCTLPGHGACTTTPNARPAPALPVGDQPGLLGEVDLPPAVGVDAPWVGSDPTPATQNPAATRCDDSDFSGGHFTGAVTRSFVIPRAARLSTEFGLTETAGVQGPARARAFVAGVRKKLAGCHDRDLGTAVTQVTRRSSTDADLTVWRLDVDVSKTKTVHFSMAIIRNRGVVAQLTFVPSGTAVIPGTAFTALAERAQQRLAYLLG